jgi:nucleoside-diphosphate-sugar epimerase
MKKVLLTGASGFIGRQCIPFLLGKGYEVHAVSRQVLPFADPKIHWHHADLLDSCQIHAILDEICPTHLLHLAWYTLPGQYMNSSENNRWFQSGIDLVNGFIDSGGERIIVAGTCFEYDWSNGYCSEHTTPINPSTLYGTAKNSLHLAIETAASGKCVSNAWGRIFFLYGPYEYPERLISSVIISLLKNEPARCSRGNQIRDYLYVEDVASAFVALLDSDVQGPVNIASGIPVTLKEIIQKIGEKLKGSRNIRLGAIQSPADEAPSIIADTHRLNLEVGWKPSVDIDEGLERSIVWWKQQLLIST